MDKIKFSVSIKVQAGKDMGSLRDYGDFVKMVFTVPS
jgi:hypothetical protein